MNSDCLVRPYSLPLISKVLFIFLAAISAGNGVAAGEEAKSTVQSRTCNSVTYAAPSGPQNDIAFVFDKPYACGQFANGDWWVSADTGGGVTIISITPAATSGAHGYEVNPRNKSRQGFDSRIAGYEPELSPELPLIVRSDASVVKAVSASGNKKPCRPCLQYAAVLTITRLPVDASSSKLRPGYYGEEKKFYRLADTLDEKLPRYPASCCNASKNVSISELARRFQGVQLDHLEGWTGGAMHPRDNMPNYGADIARDNATSLLRMLLDDFDFQNRSHKRALINYLQMSVDLQSMAVNGVTWPANGGHGNGRKLPLILAGWLLDEPDFNNAVRASSFSEDQQIYISPKTSMVLFGSECTDEQYWQTTVKGRGSRTCRDPYGYVDGGGHEIGEAYQMCCTAKPWKYTALALRMLGIESRWGNDAFFEYVDRWVEHGAWASPDPCAPYNGNPKAYGAQYGPASAFGCIKGAGRWISKHGTNKDAGHYGNVFAEQLWNSYQHSSR